MAGNGCLCQNSGDRPVVDRHGGAGGSGQHGVNQQLPPTFRRDVPPPAHQVNNLQQVNVAQEQGQEEVQPVQQNVSSQ